MIIPWPKAPKSFGTHIMTWSLVFLNLFFFVAFGNINHRHKTKDLEKGLGVELKLTGQLYLQYFAHFPQFKKADWIENLTTFDNDTLTVLGAAAIKDGQFLNLAIEEKFDGDQVAIEAWKKSILNLKSEILQEESSYFGLSTLNAHQILPWITYQFSHSGWMHLLSNMIFLVMAGLLIESLVTSEALLLIYFLGGIGGGYLFIVLQGTSPTPMIGASASISALVSYAWMIEKRKNIRYFYFLSPAPGHYGAIYLPTVLFIPFLILGDFTSLLSQPEGLGMGVAYSAHVGGAFVGMTSGFVYLQAQSLRKKYKRASRAS